MIRRLFLRRKPAGACGLLLALILLLSSALPAFALPGQPHRFYGQVTIGGAPAPEGIEVSAWIGGEKYAAATVSSQGSYRLDVPADDPDTATREGGRNGDTVELRVAGVPAGEGRFESGQVTRLDLAIAALPDTTPPAVAGTDPGDGAKNVPLDKTITVTFSEDVREGPAFEAIELEDAQDNDVAIEADVSGNTLTVTPVNPLEYYRSYVLRVPAGAVEDLAGNQLADGVTVRFTTEPAPGMVAVVATDPQQGEDNVPVDKTIVVAFSVPVKPGSAYGKVALVDEGGKKVNVRKKVSGTVLTVDPVRDLRYGTAYTLVVPAGAVRAAVGKEVLEQEFRLSFRTEPPDVTPPGVVDTDPDDGGAVESLRPTIRVYFSEPVYAGKSYAKVALYDPANKRVAVSKRIVEGQVLEIRPTRALKPGAMYQLYLPQGAVKDKAGNPLAEDVWVTFATPPAGF